MSKEKPVVILFNRNVTLRLCPDCRIHSFLDSPYCENCSQTIQIYHNHYDRIYALAYENLDIAKDYLLELLEGIAEVFTVTQLKEISRVGVCYLTENFVIPGSDGCEGTKETYAVVVECKDGSKFQYEYIFSNEDKAYYLVDCVSKRGSINIQFWQEIEPIYGSKRYFEMGMEAFLDGKS